jgi:protein arginine N-methyltransferase 1
MLKDEARMTAYSKALSQKFMKDKVVLDVGSGSGALCLFAARGIKSIFGACIHFFALLHFGVFATE